MKFDVEVRKTHVERTTFEIEADTREEASRLALEEAKKSHGIGGIWELDEDYTEVVDIAPVEETLEEKSKRIPMR